MCYKFKQDIVHYVVHTHNPFMAQYHFCTLHVMFCVVYIACRLIVFACKSSCVCQLIIIN